MCPRPRVLPSRRNVAVLFHSEYELRLTYTTDRRQTKASLNAPPLGDGAIITGDELNKSMVAGIDGIQVD